jgi:hypothetical protein
MTDKSKWPPGYTYWEDPVETSKLIIAENARLAALREQNRLEKVASMEAMALRVRISALALEGAETWQIRRLIQDLDRIENEYQT